MAVSIKNERTERLARAVADETGESLTGAITHALEEKLERLRGRREAPDLAAQLKEIARRCAGLPDLDRRTDEEILGYDERGLFR